MQSFATGTSMATPNVANAAAKILAVNAKLSGADLKTLILQTADTNTTGQRLLHARRAVEAARKLGAARLADATIFTTHEPCAMCVGALLESEVEALVFAVPNDVDGAAGTVIQLAQHPALPRRFKVVSGIRRDEVERLFAPATTR